MSNERYSGNSDLQDAQVVLIGESHISSSRRLVRQVIKKDIGPKDVVLVEGVDKGNNLLSDPIQWSQVKVRYGLPLRTRIEGWDNRVINRMSTELLRDRITNKISRDIFNDKYDRYDAIRENCLMEAVGRALSNYPDRKLYVIAGRIHVENLTTRIQKQYKTTIVDAYMHPTERQIKWMHFTHIVKSVLGL